MTKRSSYDMRPVLEVALQIIANIKVGRGSNAWHHHKRHAEGGGKDG